MNELSTTDLARQIKGEFGVKGEIVAAAPEELASWFLENYPAKSPLEALAYKFARHIRNTETLDAAAWGFQAADLLTELQELDPEVYDERVK